MYCTDIKDQRTKQRGERRRGLLTAQWENSRETEHEITGVAMNELAAERGGDMECVGDRERGLQFARTGRELIREECEEFVE